MKPTLLLLLLGFLVSPCKAQVVPSLINYQGRLVDEGGTPLTNGTYRISFRIYTRPIPQNSEPVIWGRQYDINLIGGAFNVILGADGGAVVPEGAAVNDLAFAFTDRERFLELEIVRDANGTEIKRSILPRQQLLSSPFSISADNGVPTGMVLPWAGLGSGASAVPRGWLLANGQTIGSPASGADFASNQARELFRLLWNSMENDKLPILSPTGAQTSRGVSADDDFNAGKRLHTPDLRGRVAVGMGRGAGLSDRQLGVRLGSESEVISIAQLPPHHHPITDRAHQHEAAVTFGDSGSRIHAMWGGSHTEVWYREARKVMGTPAFTGITRTESTGGGVPLNIMQPFYVLSYLIKL